MVLSREDWEEKMPFEKYQSGRQIPLTHEEIMTLKRRADDEFMERLSRLNPIKLECNHHCACAKPSSWSDFVWMVLWTVLAGLYVNNLVNHG